MPPSSLLNKEENAVAASRDFYKDLEKSRSEGVRRHFTNAYRQLWPNSHIDYVDSDANDRGVDCVIRVGKRHTTTQEKVLYGHLRYTAYFFETISHNRSGWLNDNDVFNASYLFLGRMTPDLSESRINVYWVDEDFVGYCRRYGESSRLIVNSVGTGAGFMMPYAAMKKWEVREFRFGARLLK
jgi:hypothetical protein